MDNEKEYINFETLNEDIDEQTKNEFVIDTSDKADWAIEQIKQEQERFEIYEQTIKNKISDLKEKIRQRD